MHKINSIHFALGEINHEQRTAFLQDPFLNALRREHVPVSIYLVNGIKLQGNIESFDQYVVLLRNTVPKWSINTRFQRLFRRVL